MRIHHLNCATMCPVLPGWVFGEVPPEQRQMVGHCLLVESSAGLVLVDTGFGLADVGQRQRDLGWIFRHFVRPACDEAECAIRQVEALGFDPTEVRHIVLTHLDVDHAGGLADFPQARVHVLREEYEAARATDFHARLRYRPHHFAHIAAEQWSHGAPQGDRWFGFEGVRQPEGLPPEILMVPLVGHSRGHTSVAVRGDEGWLLHAGDAYFHRAEVQPAGQREPTDIAQCPGGLRTFQRVVEFDHASRVANQARLRELASGGEVRVFCAHDVVEFERLSAAS